MRPMTQPPPSSHCDQCGGELRLKLIEVADRGLDLENEIFVCANCGREQSLIAHREPRPQNAAHSKCRTLKMPHTQNAAH
jgi:hypothetical protein